MPETATAPPPAAPAAAPPAAPPTPELHVTTASVVDHGPPTEPPKKGSAREAMFNELRRRAGAEAEPEPAKPTTKPEPAREPEPAAAPPEKAASEEPGKKGKISPWKLVDEHKAARAKAEQELAELRKAVPDPAKLKQEQERIASMEKRAQELEEEIRFVNYAKSQEYAEKYEKPYMDAWNRWMQELGELRVQSADGQERPLAPEDILELVRLPLQEARQRAQEVFGDFSDDVMGARKEIKGLLDAKSRAMEEARKAGSEREAQRTRQLQEHQETLAKEVSESWKAANEAILADEKVGRFLKPIEGDDEANTRLAKGFEIADRAFGPSPFAPNLTKEQRSDIIRLHAAVRNRAAAFGRLVYLNGKMEAKIKALTEELGKFKSVQPGAGEGVRGAQAPGPRSARDEVFAALRQRAR